MIINFYQDKNILVTGGNGFIGSNLVNRLLKLNANVRVASIETDRPFKKKAEFIKADLRNLNECIRVCRNIDIIFHLAAFGFGFRANLNIQPKLFTNNVLINTNMLEAAYRENVDHYLFTSSIAVYDRNLTILDDKTGIKFNAEPHESEKYYAWAKRVGEIQCRSYHENYGMNIAIVRLSNPYGPSDTFDLEKSHVIPAFILKALSKEEEFVIKGSGKAIRNFIYVEDVVDGMLLALEKHAVCDPLNLCSKENIMIHELCEIILKKTNQEHKRIVSDTHRHEGVIKRIPKIDKAKKKIGFAAKTSISEGIQKTIAWWKDNVLGKQKSIN